MAGDRPRQPVNEIYALNVNFSSASLDSLDSRKPAHVGVKQGYFSKKWLFYRYWLV